MSKVLTAAEAVARIPDRAVVAVGGTGAVLEPDLVLETLEARFLKEGHPRDLTLVTPMLPGDRLDVGGMNCFAHEGMLAKLIGASFSMQRHPKLIEMVRAEKCEGYTVAMGTMVQLMTAIGAKKPGVFTTAGLGTFLDPRVEGGRMNARSKNPPVRIERIDGQEYLFYPSFPVNVAIIRGTTADENGYISFEEEPNTLGMLEIALAAKASGGYVVAQVKRLARANSLDPRLVRVPGPLVDAIVVHPRQTQVSPQMADPLEGWNPFLAGALKSPLRGLKPVPPGPERIILRRAALELRRGDVVNLGAGVATHLPRIALEENVLDRVIFTNEHGVFGGVMATAIGGSFVPALNADAVMDSAFQFNFYDGGGLDITFLGVGQVDAEGNVNVSRFGREWNGPGGFNNITDKTPRIVFCTSLTAGGLKIDISQGRVRVVQEGRARKFVPRVEQITLNAPRAFAKGQSVTYVTERAVFRLGSEGPELVEIAPGIDLERDVKAAVDFPLKVSERLRTMDERIFSDGPMGLSGDL
ncbi:MAG TPA: CoA-transferase [Alphaproteobacteria bacterium]